MKKIRVIAIASVLMFICTLVSAQNSNQKKSKFFINAGYGLAGSFFVGSYQESLPFPSAGYRAFYNKNFIGNALNGEVGVRLKKKYEIKAGINLQRFSRFVSAKDTIANVVINIRSTIYERNYIYFVSVNRLFDIKKHTFATGLGIYYLNPRAETIEYGYGIPNFVTMSESENGALEEGGVLAEVAYEYKFQPKVNLGIKGNFYYTLSAGYAESVTLMPFVKINF